MIESLDSLTAYRIALGQGLRHYLGLPVAMLT